MDDLSVVQAKLEKKSSYGRWCVKRLNCLSFLAKVTMYNYWVTVKHETPC